MKPPGNCAEGDYIVWRLVPPGNESTGLAGTFVALGLLCRS
jgi:hypothetical protein